MKSKFLLASCLLVSFCVAALAAEKPAPAPATQEGDKANAAKPAKKKTLEKGMTADAVLATAGKPAEIKPMAAPDPETKVEQWIYRRKLKETSVPVATGQHTVQTFGGTAVGGGVNIVETPVIDYSQKLVAVYQVTALLMINGKLEIAKQWVEQDDKQQ
jgi:hypothetical protein